VGKADVEGVRTVSWVTAQRRNGRGWKGGVCMVGKLVRECAWERMVR
jgi:hypothetical protein